MAYGKPVKNIPVNDWHDPTPVVERVRRSGNEDIETVPRGSRNDTTPIKKVSFQDQLNNENLHWLAENVSDEELSRRQRAGDSFAGAARLLKKSRGKVYDLEGYLVNNKTSDQLSKDLMSWALDKEE